MIDLRDRQWSIDCRARILVSGEVHYFRLARADWRDIGAFCDLALEIGLYVIARPGPYVMPS